MKMHFTMGKFTTRWQRLEKGIMAGYTVSAVLFVAAMKMILETG